MHHRSMDTGVRLLSGILNPSWESPQYSLCFPVKCTFLVSKCCSLKCIGFFFIQSFVHSSIFTAFIGPCTFPSGWVWQLSIVHLFIGLFFNGALPHQTAGQNQFYFVHQCFLTTNTVHGSWWTLNKYLLKWMNESTDYQLHERQCLRPWTYEDE